MRAATSADGTRSRFAGTGAFGFSGDGGPAVDAALGFVSALAVGPDGSVLLVDDFADETESATRLRLISPEGIISTIGGGNPLIVSVLPDGSPASDLREIDAIGVGPDGTVYVASDDRLYALGPPFRTSTAAAVQIAPRMAARSTSSTRAAGTCGR